MARLIIDSDSGKSGILELTQPVTTIGRGAANDLVLNDSSVSRFHAVIKRQPHGGYVIADRGSTNGVLMQGARITGDTALGEGTVARIGAYTIRFEDTEHQPLIIHRAKTPEVDHLLHRSAEPSVQRSALGSVARSELLDIIRRLETENYLLSVLFDAGKSLSSKLDVDGLLEQTMKLSFRIEGVERGFLMLFDQKGEVWRQSEVKYRVPPSSGQAGRPHIILSRSVMERLKSEQQPILINDATSDERFNQSESLRMQGLQSAMCAPLVGNDGLLGLLYVDNLQKTAAFTQQELNVFSLVASQAAAAIDNLLAHQRLARQAIQRAALERFLPPEVAEMVSANPDDARLGGANQKVTILFTDIRGFTQLSEQLDPKQVVEILNSYFTRVTDVIFDFGGMLDKFIGDAVMAVFGAPISKGDDAGNAVRAAVAIQRLMAELNRDAAARGWPELHVGIGINTGIVTAGNIGSPRRLDYTVIGDAVNTASRLVATAAAGQIIASQSTVAGLGREFQLQQLPPLLVKGKSAPLKAYSVAWKKPARARRKGAAKP